MENCLNVQCSSRKRLMIRVCRQKPRNKLTNMFNNGENDTKYVCSQIILWRLAKERRDFFLVHLSVRDALTKFVVKRLFISINVQTLLDFVCSMHFFSTRLFRLFYLILSTCLDVVTPYFCNIRFFSSSVVKMYSFVIIELVLIPNDKENDRIQQHEHKAESTSSKKKTISSEQHWFDVGIHTEWSLYNIITSHFGLYTRWPCIVNCAVRHCRCLFFLASLILYL